MHQIKLVKFDNGNWDIFQQLKKISEEHHEVLTLGFAPNITHERMSEELLDLMQACKTGLEILARDYGGNYYITKANFKHIAKLKQREALGLIKLMDESEIKSEVSVDELE
jgi:hypothetical protein